MDATLPALHLFHRETGAMRQDLKDLMVAWTVSRSDEALGYVSIHVNPIRGSLNLMQNNVYQDYGSCQDRRYAPH